MAQLLSIVLVVIFILLSSIHFYWAFGGTWAINAALPTDENGNKLFQPSMFASLVVAFGLLFFAFIVIIHTYIFLYDNSIFIILIKKYGLKIIAFIFLFRAIGDFKYVGLFKKNKNSVFAIQDTKYFTPLCFIIFLLCIFLLLS